MLIFQKRNKLGNQKMMVDGIMFDSKAEAMYYWLLKDMLAKGQVKSIKLQPKVVLLPKFESQGRKWRELTYTPDFLVEYPDGRLEYIDVKGKSTQQGELRRKLFAYVVRDIPLRWIAESKGYGVDGFIDYDELQKIRRKKKKTCW